MRSWAPYGMKPCTRHENVSMMLAALRGSIPKRSAISRAICPVVMMAIVLFAVQRLASETSPAMLNSAPRLPLMRLVSPLLCSQDHHLHG